MHPCKAVFLTFLVVSTFLWASSQAVFARNDLKFDGFRANLNDIISGMSTYCKKQPGVMDSAISAATSNDIDLFRKACGQGLRSNATPFGDWQFLYSTRTVDDGHGTVYGVLKRFTYDNRSYLLAIGEERITRYPGQTGEKTDTRPVALLNIENGTSKWQQVFDFVRYDGLSWNVREGSISDFSSANVADDIPLHGIWQRYVANDFGNLVASMKDMDWPNRN
ncbi:MULTISPECIES: hypothetical protein [Thalassospira]|uniref:Uncharacterized protein n=2 Tax=Thalassospira TaxID=168934 RepID=A0A367W2W0_9PROT|nr:MULTISPECIES: hypothetical protein [Thalassospira]MDG4718386.1 hypothetical protein [Thalassospira sp. FZY0004]RCK34693.1 hypothetical protein TH19_15785 [Thalassospira profundimaris]